MENVLHAPAQRRGGNRTATLAACVLAAFALLAVVMAGIALYGQATVTDFTAKNLGPSFEHPFGTDWMGRDMLARVLAGLSTSVLVGLLAAGVSSVIALVLGCAAALGGKRVDAVVSWLIDLMMGVPHIVLLVLISFALGKGFWGVTIGVAVTHWASLARVVRAEVLPRGGYLATCSCSHFMDTERFKRVVSSAAHDAGVQLRQIEERQQAPDHPIVWGIPETNYLKFFLFQVV